MSLRVMSFNVRYDEPEDGPDRWEYRAPVAAEMIGELRPDIVGLQEPEIEQLRDLDKRLPDYRRFGVSRYGNETEKFAAVMFQRERLHLVDWGSYWLSESPDVPASSSWLIHKPYAVNWGRLKDQTTGRTVVVHNVHFPYKPEQAEARVQSAVLMRERSAGNEDTLLTGDFNSNAGGDVYRCLREQFSDAFESDHRAGPPGTFHGFSGIPNAARLDWILFRGRLLVERFETVTFHRNGRYPSDHFPVMADFYIEYP